MDRPGRHTVELHVTGMDCAGCARTVRSAVADVPGVRSVDVRMASEKAVVELASTSPASVEAIREAIAAAGYTATKEWPPSDRETRAAELSRRVFWIFGFVSGAVLLLVVAGEWLGLLESITARVPFAAGAAIVLILGYPVFAQVVRAALRKRVIAHSLMTVGALAALLAGQWVTAAIVVFFMRTGDSAERFTTQRARNAIRSLTKMAPKTGRVERGGAVHEIAVDDVQPGDIIIVRPGEQIPVDGEVIGGHATINQASITGESVPVEAVAGSTVFAATIAQGGALRIHARAAGRDTTFGRIVRMVEEAESNRGQVQRLADRFSAYYLPFVAAVAVLTYLLSQNLMATVAVLVVACACAFALATPVAMLASIGAAARRGLLIKGGQYIESLEKADVVLLDKTGTLTLGHPQITEVIPLNGMTENELLALSASAEVDSEHPLAEAVRSAAECRGLPISEPSFFEAVPGMGIRAIINGREVVVGNERLASAAGAAERSGWTGSSDRSLLYVDIDGKPAGLLAATDTLRTEVPQAIDALRRSGITHIELLTGDREEVAESLAQQLDLRWRARLLPEDKIEIVRAYQADGLTVVMIGDGVNDAPALAQADVGIAMGAAGTEAALEASHVALLRDDWRLVPELFRIARRTMHVVKLNIGLTALYNAAGLTLAAFGILPPIFAAAAQSIPDIGILANSARLIRQKSLVEDHPAGEGTPEALNRGTAGLLE